MSCECGCCHHHDHHRDKKKEKRRERINRIAITLGVLLFIGSFYIKYLLIPSYLLLALPIIWAVVRNIRAGESWLEENFLVLLTVVAAILINEKTEAALIMVLYHIGEQLQGYAVNKNRKAIESLLQFMPEEARLIEGKEIKLTPSDEIPVGSRIAVLPGDRVPLDGVIVEGTTELDTAAVTGESLPVAASAGSEVLSGSINISGAITVETTKEYHDSIVGKMKEMVENNEKPSRMETFIHRFAKVYTPLVVLAAVLLALIPSLMMPEMAKDFVYRSLVFLSISCPCALLISIPLAFLVGIGAASKRGIFVKGSGVLEELSRVGTVAFDKTGTLTKGELKVSHVRSEGEDFIPLAAAGEAYSSHPIAKAICDFYGKQPMEVSARQEFAGQGISYVLEGKEIKLGTADFTNAPPMQEEFGATVMHMTVDGEYTGYAVLEDSMKDESLPAMKALQREGYRTCILSGDRKEAVEPVAKKLGAEFRAPLLPHEKAEEIGKLQQEGRVLFVGDGLNDTPSLLAAEVGAAMGGVGCDAATDAADVVLTDANIGKVPLALLTAKRTVKIAKQTTVFIIGFKFAVMLAAFIIDLPVWAAMAADVGVAVLSIANAMRAGYLKLLPEDCSPIEYAEQNL